MRFRIVAAALLATLAMAPATAQQYGRWGQDIGQGVISLGVATNDTNRFALVDARKGAPRPGGVHVETEIDGKSPPPGTTLRVRVDGRDFLLPVNDAGEGVLNGTNRTGLWQAIRRGRTLSVTYSTGASSEFPLDGSSRALGPKPF